MALIQRLASLTPTGRARVPAAWALDDFANTIFSFAVVSNAIGLWLVDDARFGERDGNFLLSLAIVISVGLNAIVSPILIVISPLWCTTPRPHSRPLSTATGTTGKPTARYRAAKPDFNGGVSPGPTRVPSG